jgi:hypothetical protein
LATAPFSGDNPASSDIAWNMRAEADHTYFEKVEADGVDFPAEPTTRSFALDKDRLTIGRRSASRGIYPDIDLSAPPTDTGISHQHAVLVRQNGTWGIVDSGSANGTYLNDSLEAIPPDKLIPISAADRIHIGAWTTLTVHPPFR